MDAKLTFQNWDIDKLIPYVRNPRKNDEQVDRMCASIREFGFRIPIVAKSDGSVVDGYLRLKAARRLGLTEVPVVLADELTEAQVKAFRILANQSANWAEWDNDLLKLELEDLQSMDYDLDQLGFDAAELDSLLDLFDDQEGSAQGQEEKYTTKIATPIYEPTGRDVELRDCFDKTKMAQLVDHQQCLRMPHS